MSSAPRLRRLLLRPTPRPFVAFATTSKEQAFRLYRAQNLIWAWLGIAGVLNAAAYFVRPHLGPVVLSPSPTLDVTRVVLFAIGGALITTGVWTIRRALEVLGHVSFTTGAVLNTIATLTARSPRGNYLILTAILISGLAFCSAYRAYFIVTWIGTDHAPHGG